MIRFIDIRGQGTGYRFAFWDTIRNRFCEFNGEQAWESLEDFTESFNWSGGKFFDVVCASGIKRFINLMPDWTTKIDDEDL